MNKKISFELTLSSDAQNEGETSSKDEKTKFHKRWVRVMITIIAVIVLVIALIVLLVVFNDSFENVAPFLSIFANQLSANIHSCTTWVP